jgi:Fe-S-cluster-containing hydrogenase component 2
MDKYGVEIKKDDPKVKEAADRKKCPLCGADLDGDANVPNCPRHGVKPFEPDDEKTIPDIK